jgi:hypothetical protein
LVHWQEQVVVDQTPPLSQAWDGVPHLQAELEAGVHGWQRFPEQRYPAPVWAESQLEQALPDL